MKNIFNDDRDWFFNARFGLFIHWGIYSVPAWHEQHIYRCGLTRSEYAKYAEQFNPTAFNPNRWLDLMEEAGMKYLCFTAKHIDGFCMWDTKQTTFNVVNTPYGDDIFAEIAACCQNRNVPLCVYYSIADMNCPNYPNSGQAYELPAPEPGDEPDVRRYIEFVRNQVTELCSNYGDLHGFWWDANKLGIHEPSLNDLIRRLQPKAIINNRGLSDGDFSTPERECFVTADDQKDDSTCYTHPVEACESIGAESWGYRQDEDYFSERYLIRNIDKHMAKGGNYLLNVGPRLDGTLPCEAEICLRNIGKWYKAVNESFINALPAPEILRNKDFLVTRNANVLYLHLWNDHPKSGLKLDPITILPQKAILLNNRQTLNVSLELFPTLFQTKTKYLHVTGLPINEMSNTAMIIRLDFESKEMVDSLFDPKQTEKTFSNI